MLPKDTKKPKNVDYFQVPPLLWKKIKKLLPKPSKRPRRGRPRADNRAILNGIWYVLWTGCQWKAVHRNWFGVCSSVLHERFQVWRKQGIWYKVMQRMVKFYDKQRQIKWKWQAIDSKSCPAPLGGTQAGKNPTDRGKQGAKLHLLVDQAGAPLALHITGANEHDKWSADDLMISIVVPRPKHKKQHLCADKGYDFEDVHHFVEQERYIAHIKHKRKRGEPVIEACPMPGEKRFPARRWVVERTLSWLTKRRSIRIRWCKHFENWKALIQFACAHILFNMAFYG
jgi:putative transposase